MLLPGGSTAMTVNVIRHTGTVKLFSCSSAADCAQQRTHTNPHPLHGVCGMIEVQMTPVLDLTLTWYTGRAVQTAPVLSLAAGVWTTDAALQRLALTALLPGEYLFAPGWFTTQPTHCVPCPPGMLCAESIESM
jgi:hypothetical protein